MGEEEGEEVLMEKKRAPAEGEGDENPELGGWGEAVEDTTLVKWFDAGDEAVIIDDWGIESG